MKRVLMSVWTSKFQTNSSWNLSSQFAWLIHSSTLVSFPQTATLSWFCDAKPTQLSWAASQREPQTSTCLRCLYNQRAANMYANSIGGAGVGYLSGGKYHVRICLAYLSVQVPSTCLSVRCILSWHDLNAKERRVRIPIVIMMLRMPLNARDP